MTLICGIIAGIIGFAYLGYGKREANFHFLIAGMLLMFYPYFVTNGTVAIILGIVFAIVPFITNAYM